MKNILFHTNSYQDRSLHYIFYNDPDFIESFKKYNINFVQSRHSNGENFDCVLFLEAGSIGVAPKRSGVEKIYDKLMKRKLDDQIYKKYKKQLGVEKLYLIIAEGVIHAPENHVVQLSGMVNSVLTWNDDLVDGVKFKKYNWPLPLHWCQSDSFSNKTKKNVVNISANKYSSVSGELYTARRTAINVFEERFPDNFDLYGIGWNRPATRVQHLFPFIVPSYKSYKGSLESKAYTLQQYKFALCYENASVRGWITEKIFDCFRSGCIPIYLGAPNIEDYVPSEAFIDRRKFATDQDVADYLDAISPKEIKIKLECISEYLKSKQYCGFIVTSFAKRIAELINA